MGTPARQPRVTIEPTPTVDEMVAIVAAVQRYQTAAAAVVEPVARWRQAALRQHPGSAWSTARLTGQQRTSRYAGREGW